MGEPIFKRMALIGVGLIGSSLARRAREFGELAAEVIASDSSQKVLDRVVELGIADRVEVDPVSAVAGADLVVLCAPVGAYAELATQIAPNLAPGVIVTDVGSTKVSVIRDVGPVLPAHTHFVPGHPLAGTEFSGPDAGFSALFEGRWTILTPPPGTDEDAVARLRLFWERTGAQVVRMDAPRHDRVLAIVSHLPHLLAFTI